ncbi:MAG TPA: hypothetical protein VFH78_14450 [Candidatus Thermoplasmatota archaeon]|nr:hypothetical protein [Candidatus Thermoplasmatota archaeon]
MKHVAIALALLALAPLASAHVESYTQSRSMAVGPFLIYFEPRPTPPFAQSTVSMVAQFSDNNTGTLLRDVPSRVQVEGPDGYAEEKTMAPDGTGYHIASLVLPAAGNYTARVHVTDRSSGQEYSAQTDFEVFPNIPFRIRPVDSEADAIVGVRTPLAFEVIDPTTFARKDPGDLRVRIEHWSEDHTEFRGAEEVSPTRLSPGVWRIDHVFRSSGMYHIRFASDAGGFNYADVPLLHVYATAAGTPPPQEGNDTPWPTLGAVAVALLAALLLTRKR